MSYNNRAAPGVPFYSPAQEPPAGTLIATKDKRPVPKLFTPLTIRGLTVPNRIVLSPLDQYSCKDGHLGPWHDAHLGGIIQRGPGLSFIEATAICPNGRVTPQDAGLWQDSQIDGVRRVVDFAHSQGQKIAIQLAHAGRKASTVAPWLARHAWAGADVGGWPHHLDAPSDIPYDFAGTGPTPKVLTLGGIDRIVSGFRAATVRALEANVDAVEIHAAHGYLIHEFLSPVTNVRRDNYGGSFENRVRLLLRVTQACREAMPHSMPLFVRISATDWLEENDIGIAESWTCDQSAKLAALLQDAGVDVLDVSTGGLHPKQKPRVQGAYQAPFAQKIKRLLGPDSTLMICAVGNITTARVAEALLQGREGEPPMDIIAIGRGFQRNPGLVHAWAEDLQVQVKLPYQIGWAIQREVRDRILGVPVKL